MISSGKDIFWFDDLSFSVGDSVKLTGEYRIVSRAVGVRQLCYFGIFVRHDGSYRWRVDVAANN